MPQRKRKLRSAEEILGIQPLRPAEEILGITRPGPTIERARRLGLDKPPAPPPQEPEGMFSSFQTGVAGPLLRNVVETAADVYNAPGETLQRAGRGALEFISAFDPAGNAYDPTGPNAQRLAELGRRADERLPEPIKSMKAGMAIEEAKPRTFGGRIAGGAGSILGEVAFPTAPENLAGNIITAPFGAAAMKVGGKFVAPILRRIRGGRNVGAAVAEAPISEATPALRPAEEVLGVTPQASPTVQTAMQRFSQAVEEINASNLSPVEKAKALDGAIQSIGREASGIPPVSADVRAGYPGPMEFPENPNPMQVRAGFLPGEGPPPLEAELGQPPFSVRAAPELAYSETTGPSLNESAAFELPESPELATKAERTPILQTISSVIKAGLLTKPTTHLKNVGATGLFQVSEEVSRIPAAILDVIMSPVTKRRTLSGPNLASVARSAYTAATKGVDDAIRILKTGKTPTEIQGLEEIASGSKVIDSYVNGVFRLLKAEDAVFKSYALKRALEDRARSLALTEIRRGDIPRSQLGSRFSEIMKAPPEDLATAAVLDAEVATFNNPNLVGRFISGGKQAAEKLPGGQAFTFTADRIIPFANTPSNVIARMLEYTPLGGVKNVGQIAKAIAKKSFTAEQQRQFVTTFGRASTGSGLLALGYIGYRDGWLTGMQEDDTSKRARDTATGRIPGAILINGTWHQITGFSPPGNIVAIGAALAREAEQAQVKAKEQGKQPGLLEQAGAAAKVAGQAALEQPLLAGTKQLIEGLEQPGTLGSRYLGSTAGSVVPGAVSDVAGLFDSTQRAAQTIPEQLMQRIPGARNTLPVKLDATGQPIEAPNPLNPLKSTTARQVQNPFLSELVRLDIGISTIEKKPDETDEQHRQIVQNFGSLYLPYGQQLVASPQYQQASESIRKEAIKKLNERAKELVERGQQKHANGPLSPAALIGAAKGSEAREKAKKRGK